MRGWVLAALALGGCTAGTLSRGGSAADAGRPVDALVGQGTLDAAPRPMDRGPTQLDRGVVDARPPVDARVPPDAAPPPRPDQGAPDMAPPPGPRDRCGDLRAAQKVYNGTRDPTHVPLTPGQILAIGSFNGCTGTLITGTWVLSAEHCGHTPGVQFCVGEDPARPERCVRAIQVFNHPQVDMALLELERPLADVAPGVEPIAIVDFPLGGDWIGRTAEAAGYGQTEAGQFNVRWFTAQPIARLDAPYITIDGQGQRGVCFGDSGGPVLINAPDGTVRVAGDLSHGDPSCVGQDNFTRTDLQVEWIERYTGPTVPGASGGCGLIDATGRCEDGAAVWCEADTVRRQPCATCGWDPGARGFRCVAGPDPCQGLDGLGRCDGDTARWCADGVPRARDCAACGQYCAPVDRVGADCVADPCAAGLDYLGRCNGDTAEWCDAEGYHRQDCAAEGQRCDYVNDNIGWFCQ